MADRYVVAQSSLLVNGISLKQMVGREAYFVFLMLMHDVQLRAVDVLKVDEEQKEERSWGFNCEDTRAESRIQEIGRAHV